MPDGSWRQADILCPFYRDDNPRQKTISCEGVFSRASLTNRFQRQREREMQLDIFCADQYRKCEIFRAIMEEKNPED